MTDYYNGNLTIVDVSNPANPILISSIKFKGGTHDVILSSDDTKVFVTGYYDSNLNIVDVNNLANPMLIGSINVGNYIRDITLSSDNTKAFVATDGGLIIIDIEEFINNQLPPIIQSGLTLQVNENSLGGTFVGQLNVYNAYTINLSGTGSENFKVYNNGTIVVAEGANLDYESKTGYALKATAVNDYGNSNTVSIYININNLLDILPVLQDTHLDIYKITPADTTIGVIKVTSSMHCNVIEYISDDNSMFGVRDNGDVYTKTITSKGNYTINVYALSSCGNSNTVKLTISADNIMGSINSMQAYNVVLSSDDTKAFVTDCFGNNLNIIDVSNPANPILISSIHVGNFRGVTLSSDDTRVFVVDDDGNLKIVDVNNPANPILISSIYVGGYIYDVVLSSDNTKAFVNDYLGGNLTIVIVSNPANPILISSIYVGDTYGVTLSSDDTKVFVVGSRNLKIVDVSNPANPILISSINVGNYAYDIALSSDNTKAFVTNYDNGNLKIVDVSNPANPILISSIEVAVLYYAHDVTLSFDDTKAFVTNYDNGNLKIVDVSNPANPILISSINVGNYAYDTALSSDNTKAFVATDGGLIIIDIEEFINNQLPPIIKNDLTLQVNENSPGGTFVGQLAVYNLDSVTSIVLSGYGADNFKVYNNGTIVVAERANLNYERQSTYVIKATAANSYGYSALVDLTINLNDLPDTPPVVADFQDFSVDEGSLGGTIVGKLIINNVFSPITSIKLSGNGAEKFRVDNNGTITVAEGANLNYEISNIYKLYVIAYNEFGASSMVYISIFVNNFPNPYISYSWFDINENLPSGTVVGKLTVEDYGSPIASIYFEGIGSENFDIALDGTIIVANNAILDYETKRYYNFRVFAVNNYGKSDGTVISIYLNNIPDSPPVVSGAIIKLDNNAQAGDEVGYLSIYTDGSGIDDIYLSGEGSENFDMDFSDCHTGDYHCSLYIRVSESANLDYFNDGIYKIYISVSNEFGNSSADIWIVSKRGSEALPPEFDNITFVTFGGDMENGYRIGNIYPVSENHCEITDYFTDNDKFTIRWNWQDRYIEISSNEFMQGGKVYHLNIYANSTCGVSNGAGITVDAMDRTTAFDATGYDYEYLSLVDNETKLFVGDSYNTNSTYVVDLKSGESIRLNLQIGKDKNVLSSIASKDGKYLYAVICEYNVSCVLNIYDMSSPYSPVLIGLFNMGYLDMYDLKTILSKDGSKLFLPSNNTVYIINVNNPYLPEMISKIGSYNEITMVSISKDEKVMYIIGYDNSGSIAMQRYDISSLYNPVRLAPISFKNSYAIIGMSEDDNLVYTSGKYGLATYDVSDANNLTLVNLYSRPGSYYHMEYMNVPITLNNNKLLVSSKTGKPFTIFDLSDPKKPYVSAIMAISSPFYFYKGLILTADESKVFALGDNVLMMDIEGIGK
ncbi:MAG: hypothetical protein LBG21_00185 [Campylobacteraceae bacterium]|nr:hypothetical protein [Campylobacteraceae bacterium]